MTRARVLLLTAALGPLDYRVPDGMTVEPGSVVVAPLGPRKVTGIVWDEGRLPGDEIACKQQSPNRHPQCNETREPDPVARKRQCHESWRMGEADGRGRAQQCFAAGMACKRCKPDTHGADQPSCQHQKFLNTIRVHLGRHSLFCMW